MSAPVRIELDARQQQVILSGLRNLRSSIALNMCDPTPENIAQRQQDLAEVDQIADLVRGNSVVVTAEV